MSSQLLTVTWQGAALAALSNILAQSLTAYRSTTTYSFDYKAFIQMVVLAILLTPPNYKWQYALEDNFPSHGKKDKIGAGSEKESEKKKSDDIKAVEKESLSIPNTIIKFLLDQTFGAVANNVMFIVGINLLRGAGWDAALAALQRDFWTMLKAGYTFWPFVTLTNLIVVPVEQRMLVGNLAGLAWGVFVNLLGL